MVLAFLRAEAPARGWADRYADSPLLPDDLDSRADPEEPGQNQRRRDALAGARGYRRDRLLFAGLPSDIRWYHALATIEQLASFSHLDYPTFNRLTGGSRLVGDGAPGAVTVAEEGLSEQIDSLAEAVKRGERHPALIALASSLDASPVILEGNKRASAYVRELPRDLEIEVIVWVSLGVRSMRFF